MTDLIVMASFIFAFLAIWAIRTEIQSRKALKEIKRLRNERGYKS